MANKENTVLHKSVTKVSKATAAKESLNNDPHPETSKNQELEHDIKTATRLNRRAPWPATVPVNTACSDNNGKGKDVRRLRPSRLEMCGNGR